MYLKVILRTRLTSKESSPLVVDALLEVTGSGNKDGTDVLDAELTAVEELAGNGLKGSIVAIHYIGLKIVQLKIFQYEN